MAPVPPDRTDRPGPDPHDAACRARARRVGVALWLAVAAIVVAVFAWKLLDHHLGTT